MDKKHIGLIFSYDENWIGGSYYLLNIVHALKGLSEDEKPVISILSPKQSDFDLVKQETGYEDLRYIKFPRQSTLVIRALNKAFRMLTGRDSSLVKMKLKGIDFIYPNYSDAISNKSIPKVFWIPDFQEEFLPHFFSDDQISWRRKHNSSIASKADLVVFSSEDAKKHFMSMFPEFKKRTAVLPFAVTHPSTEKLNFIDLRRKYNLPDKYYFSPNQFWAHKNHVTILKALKVLKEGGEYIVVVFSGKEHDYRSPGYFKSLQDFVKDNDLQDNVRFLGFIDRVDQLVILRNSLAVIQPSLFEGWSTVVEDAKAQGKFLILSDLNVHQEQMVGREASFFDPVDVDQLSTIMKSVWNDGEKKAGRINYDKDIRRFGEKFLEMTNISS